MTHPCRERRWFASAPASLPSSKELRNPSRSPHGRPKARETVVEVDEDVEVGGLHMSGDAGEGWHRPGRAKAARVGRNFREET